jgi:ribosomal protein L29
MKRLDELKKYRSMAKRELEIASTDLRSKILTAEIKLKGGELKDTKEVNKLKRSLARTLSIIKESAEEEVDSNQGGKE